MRLGRIRQGSVWLAVCLTLACSPRGEITMMPQASAVGEVRSVFVATDRRMDAATGQFTGGRAPVSRFARFDVSVPPEREAGQIVWPKRGRKPNPETDFLTTYQQLYATPSEFRRALRMAMAQPFWGHHIAGPEAVVYVHGFNNTFSEGVYRIAQLSSDLNIPGVAVHYSWPSLGKPLAYVYDRDSALYARDGLEQLLEEVAASGAERIILVGHSMGAALIMETLRQMAIEGETRARVKLAGVVLISPDVDVEVFRSQALRIGKLPQPFLIFTSQKDRALALSARLTGQRERLGNLEDVSQVADLEVTLFEVGAFSSGAGHFTAGDSPALLQILGRLGDINTAFGSDRSGRVGLINGTVLTLQAATRVVLSPVTAIAEEISR